MLDFPAERYEIVLSDDGSSDRSASIAQELQRRFPSRIRVLIGSGRKGPGPAINAAVASAYGDICAVLAADAFVDKNYLRIICSHFDNTEVQAVVSQVEFVQQHGETSETTGWLTLYSKQAHGFVAFRREAFERAGGYDPRFLRQAEFLGRPVTLFFREDTDMLLSLIDSGYPVVFEEHAIAFHEAYVGNLRLLMVWGLNHMMDVLLLKKHPSSARQYLGVIGSIVTKGTLAFVASTLAILLFAVSIRSAWWLLALTTGVLLTAAYMRAAIFYKSLRTSPILRPLALYAYLAACFVGRVYGSAAFRKLLL
jgi:glycosyltransferase involved in cell wall biosynthesis